MSNKSISSNAIKEVACPACGLQDLFCTSFSLEIKVKTLNFMNCLYSLCKSEIY